jgi:hypothetical protein
MYRMKPAEGYLDNLSRQNQEEGGEAKKPC